jgi:hypothetical protein
MIELAAAAVALVGPYIAKGAEELAKEIGKEAAPKVMKLWDTLKGALTKRGAGGAVQDFEQQPEDADAQGQLRIQIKKSLSDDELRGVIQQLVAEAEAALPADNAVKQYVNQVGSGNVANEIAGSGNTIGAISTGPRQQT